MQVLLRLPFAFALKGEWMQNMWVSLRSSVERSGPAAVKFFQWASSRRDLFSTAFCDFFGELHSHNRPHSWEHSQVNKFSVLVPQVVGWGVGSVRAAELKEKNTEGAN